MKKKLFISSLIIISCYTLIAQKKLQEGVNIDKLVKVENKYYLSDNFSKCYSGKAYGLFPDKKINFLWEIENGIVIRFIEYSTLGKIVSEENFNKKGIYSGKFFLGNENGDTLELGNYRNGKKIGKWITQKQ